MRRKDREVTDRETILKIVDACDILRIGLSDGDFPYIVPVNFAWEEKEGELAFYFHCAVAGRKYELMKKQGCCSFEMDRPLFKDIMPEKKDITMRYESVMGTAKVRFLEDAEKRAALENILLARYENTKGFAYNEEALKRCTVVKLSVKEITAKVNPVRQ